MNEILNNREFLLLIMSLIISLAVCIIFIFILQRRKKDLLIEASFLHSFIQDYRSTLGIEKNLEMILTKLQKSVEAPNYSFYIYNSSNQRYTLKAVRQLTSDMKIAPSYSGLLPYEKERFAPPLSLPKDSFPSKTTVIKEGEVPLLSIPVMGEMGLIRIGPIKAVPRNVLKNLDKLGNLLDVPVKNLLDEEDQKRTYEVLETSARAVKFINQLFVHEENYLKLLIQKYVETMQPLTCMLIQTNSSFQRVTYSFGVSKRTIQYLNEDLTIYTKIKEIVSGKSFSIVPNSSSIHRKLKELLKINLGDYVIIVHFSLLGKHYTLLFSFERKTEEIEGNRNQLTKALWAHIQNYVKTKQTAKQVSNSYIELLKCLADMLDEMSPFTVGYSKQMSRYSMAIAKEMGLSEFQVRSVGLSAYLSNIGVIGLTDGLLSKEGKYTEEEFEQMKLHSEVGEAIIENTIAQEEIALNIRYHHERVDGNGYPSRLVGEEIPIGARIIAVVQTFLAKINGRSYRDPLPFDDALKLLKQASGSQLDSRIVVTFLNWYEQKRKQTINSNKALGSCWELLCTPSSICLQCPAYGQTSKNCWEYQGNNCLAHGKTCETCFVYTEAMTRLDRSKKVVKQG